MIDTLILLQKSCSDALELGVMSKQAREVSKNAPRLLLAGVPQDNGNGTQTAHTTNPSALARAQAQDLSKAWAQALANVHALALRAMGEVKAEIDAHRAELAALGIEVKGI
jgi:hypothetical protein